MHGNGWDSHNVSGQCLLCMVDVVPVKNEDGLVIMFILNFEVMTEEILRNRKQELNHRLPTWLVTGRPRGFKLRLPLLRSLSNSKVSLDDAEAGHIPTATPLPLHPDHHSPEALGLGEFLPLPPLPPGQEKISGNRSSLQRWPEDQQEDQHTLLGSEPPQHPPPLTLHGTHLVGPLTQSTPCVAPHHRLSLNPDASGSNCSLSQSRSRESFHSMRRASSVDEIEAMRPDWDRKNRRASIRPSSSSTGAVNSKSNILNSTSDSDLMRYRTISKIPQITLNFVDFKPDPLIALPSGEMDIIAPCKLIDRTHNVTEKVTQDTQRRQSCVTLVKKDASLLLSFYQGTRGTWDKEHVRTVVEKTLAVSNAKLTVQWSGIEKSLEDCDALNLQDSNLAARSVALLLYFKLIECFHDIKYLSDKEFCLTPLSYAK
ncbi:Potassium voltage-gated channel subfamily H member 2 [Channa argus]|uniref:Potassium voltage-gated channel subfamily H member 2 n=1 Tax=Channa argus TaxID=215402 RepID=A0A6G1QLX5_CHAAH|nr:Potassium voltage-gated channel subfamily H member 2 [Channa argus]